MSPDSDLGARTRPILEEISHGHAFGTSEAGLTLLCCRLSRVLAAGIVEHGYRGKICVICTVLDRVQKTPFVLLWLSLRRKCLLIAIARSDFLMMNVSEQNQPAVNLQRNV